MNWLTKNECGKPLCNFRVHIISYDNIYTDASKTPILYACFSIDFENDNPKDANVHRVPVVEIGRINWRELDIRCRYNPDVGKSAVERYLYDSVRQNLQMAPRRTVYQFSHAGMYLIEGKPVFCTGTEVMHDHSFGSNILFEPDPMCQKLNVDGKLSEEEAAAEFFRLLTLSPNPARIISTYRLGFFMRPAYERIGKVPKGCIYLYGRSGTQKTTFSSVLIQTYDRENGIKNPSRLNASVPAAVNMLLENPNEVVIMDDLCPMDSKDSQRQMEKTLIEITRYIADGTTPARMKGKNLSQGYPQCGVIFTGEYLIGRGSDAARLLPVEMTKPDTKELRYFQEHPLIVSTFYRYYITWFIDHYDEVCDVLEQLREAYDNLPLTVHDRLREMYFFLGSSYFLFLQYLFEKKLLSESEARRLYQSFDELIVMLIKQQNERVIGKRSENLENEDYLQQIRMLYKTGQMSIASDAGMFDKKLHDGLLHNNRLYLRRDRLPAYFPDSTIEDIAGSLEAQGALETGKKSRTKQINCLNGMRFYVILLRYLN